ncbi:kinase-like domain-containing protein [Cunninghamella echinulata]|nr:kinase-like domain-containing protein [Cunninghamella echinulata]
MNKNQRQPLGGIEKTNNEKFGVVIPKDPPKRPAAFNYSTSSKAAMTADALFKKLDKENRLPLLRQSDRNTAAASSSTRLTTQNAIKKPTLSTRPSYQQLQQQQHQQLHKQQQLRRKPTTATTKLHVVTDAEVPEIMYDKENKCSYTKLQFLGEGGFARCYKVKDEYGRYFAAKVIAKISLVEKKYRVKLHGEIIAHGMMNHKRIVRFYSCFEDHFNVYLILELCENKTFVEMIKARKYLTEPEVRYYLIQLLDACKYMHEQRVVHRDIKLSNIFLDHEMNIKIGDFGLSALLKNPEERKKTVCGTPNYIAPEILFGKEGHNQKVDLWAIGILMYTLLTGKHPFQMNAYKSIYKKIHENSKLPSYSFPSNIHLSTEAKDLISKLLVNDPDVRIAIPEIIQHPFLQHPDLPSRIPHFAMKTEPTLVDLKPLVANTPLLLESIPTLHEINSTGPDRRLVQTVVSTLDNALKNKDYFITHRKGVPIEPIIWDKNNSFINKWIDFTTKYGLGYNISDGERGVLFNDTTTLITFDDIIYKYIIHGVNRTIQEYHVNDIPSHLKKKVYIMENFRNYMNEKLACIASDIQSTSSNGIFLVKYIVVKEAVVFRLSNKVLQFNFFTSKDKLIFTEYGAKVIYVDGVTKVLRMYELSEAIATRHESLLNNLTIARNILQAQMDIN